MTSPSLTLRARVGDRQQNLSRRVSILWESGFIGPASWHTLIDAVAGREKTHGASSWGAGRPASLQAVRGARHRADRPSVAGAVPAAAGRAGLCAPGRAARIPRDGRLPRVAVESAGRGGRVPGDVAGAGPQG